MSGTMPVLIDSGFRRGTDIVKALAMGAKGVAVGRPYLWGLGAFGQAGVERVLELLRLELLAAMQQVGAPSHQAPRSRDGETRVGRTHAQQRTHHFHIVTGGHHAVRI